MTDRDSLIDSFVDDAPPWGPAPMVALVLALAVTLTLVVCGGLPLLDATGRAIRGDYWAAVVEPMVAAKQVVPLLVLVLAAPVALASPRPESTSYPLLIGPLIALALFPLAAIVTLLGLPADGWPTAIVGKSLSQCLVTVPSLAVLMLAGQLYALRRGAVTRPALAGLTVGLIAGAAAALVYALICDDDSPAFYGIWYTVAIGLCALIGAAAGRLTLRW